METSVIKMPHALTLMVVLHAPAEMELQEMASPVKVRTLSLYLNNPYCYSPYILEGSIRNIRVHPLSIFAAQCTTNFQLVLGPVDSCLNWRVSQNLCKHTITHVFLHIRLPRALLSVLLCPFSLIQPRQSYQISRWQQSLCSTSPSVTSRKPNSPASTTRPRK